MRAAVAVWFDPEIANGRTYTVDKKTNRRTRIDPDEYREHLETYLPTLSLCETLTSVAQLTAGDLARFPNKFVECLKVYKSELDQRASAIDIGKRGAIP